MRCHVFWASYVLDNGFCVNEVKKPLWRLIGMKHHDPPTDSEKGNMNPWSSVSIVLERAFKTKRGRCANQPGSKEAGTLKGTIPGLIKKVKCSVATEILYPNGWSQHLRWSHDSLQDLSFMRMWALFRRKIQGPPCDGLPYRTTGVQRLRVLWSR